MRIKEISRLQSGVSSRAAAAVLGFMLGYQGMAVAHDAVIAKHSGDPLVTAPAAAAAPAAGLTFSNCAAAWAAGQAPIYRGEPGYSPHLDRDGDGVACE